MFLLKCNFTINIKSLSKARDMLFIYLLFFLLGNVAHGVSVFAGLYLLFTTSRWLFPGCLPRSLQKAVQGKWHEADKENRQLFHCVL